MPAICVTESKYISPIVSKKSYMAFMPAVVLAAGIAVLSLTEASQMPSVQVNDKLVHALMYALLSASLMGAWVYTRRTRVLYYIGACVGATAYGALMELLQTCCTLTRSGDGMDVLADFAGALVGVLIMVFYHPHKQ